MTNVNISDGFNVSSRASQPFVFRSGGLFGSGKKTWSIPAAVRHMDKYPEDGIFHLRNGTLAHWLEDLGAHDLADLARETIRQRQTNPRVMLETFLVESNLVQRPRLSLKPKAVRMRYVLSGQTCEAIVHVSRGRGRGYLYGVLHPNDPWLRLDPTKFSGKPVETVVQAQTETLSISNTPHTGSILVESNATEEPVIVPVKLRVVGMPSKMSRYAVRPLVSIMLAGLLGALVGWMLGVAIGQLPSWLLNTFFDGLDAVGFWALLVGTLWGIMGAVQGFAQPVAWPVSYANGRWLLRTLIWAATFALLVVVGIWTWQQVYGTVDLPLAAPSRISILLAAISLAIFPAVLGELLSARSLRGSTVSTSQQPLLRPGLLIAVALILGIGLVAGIRLGGPAIQAVNLGEKVVVAQDWAETRWANGEAQINQLLDQLTIRYYDRRAPSNVDK